MGIRTRGSTDVCITRSTTVWVQRYLILVVQLAAGLLGLVAPAFADNPPNVLVLFTDDQQFRAIGYNNSEIKTPHLDRLAREGLIFDRAYIASPICMASRASMMTGLFPQQHGAVALDSAAFREHIIKEKRFPTLPGLLAENGYDTALCGKSNLGNPRDYGFTEGNEHPEYHDGPTFEFAHTFIASRTEDSNPFFLWVATHQPHVPLLPEQQWVDLYEGNNFTLPPNFMEFPPAGSIYNQGLPGEQYYRDSEYTRNYQDSSAGPPRTDQAMQTFMRGYYAIISRLDAQIGALVELLKEKGLYENTVVIFLSDNGYMLGNHGLGNKITMHEESVRVPMFIAGPPVKAKGQRSEALASSLDVFPTVLELAGLLKPVHLAGRSLLPLLENPEGELRDYVASECVGVGGKPGEGHRMIRTADWKYVLTGTNEEYLFDQANDPHELENLANARDHQDALKAMRTHMEDWMKRTGDSHAPPPQ